MSTNEPKLSPQALWPFLADGSIDPRSSLSTVVAAPKVEKCYSTDNEDFSHTEVGDVLDALASDGELTVGRCYYEADAMRQTASAMFDVDSLIDNMRDRAYDEAGEYAEDFTTELVGKKKHELAKLIGDWLDVNVGVSFYTVRNTVMRQVTAEDVADHDA